MKILLIYPNTMMATLVPMSLSVLSSDLRQAGHDVKIFDTTYYKMPKRTMKNLKN